MVSPDRLHIEYTTRQFADETWTARADRWHISFYVPDETVGTAVITRVIPGATPDPRRALEADPGMLDRIPRVIFTEDGGLAPAVDAMAPRMLLLLESVEVEEKWRGQSVGMSLALTAMRRIAVPGTVAVTYPAPIHLQHGPGEVCSYESDDPEVRWPDEEASEKLRQAWERRGFRPIGEAVYAMVLD
ncbi:hypothetical protein OG455_26730 [Kitasatospora sp. NBC_01287]|uniref:hypothetical protein n=1 Tax=Kitasatospora sp. NBC_01287 TaxID=2903573 RepID=UPI00224FCB9F|nr:hypothetical protein [Kitasatospora sp. NBC_01287]MCX4749060.1 hypothetical protein [Kitasatospora sp. NBC_01287]